MPGWELERDVQATVAAELELDVEELTDERKLDDLGVVDDRATKVLNAVEELLDVRFPDDFFDGLHTYGDLATAVRVATGG